MKLRYTSLQVDAGSTEEHDPGAATDLDGLPVVVGSLHSQVPGVAAAVRAAHPAARIAYVMTDGAALPIVISDLVHALRAAGLLDVTITAGHAFGGDLEAVSVPSALALARHVAGADVAIVAMGPGVVGTASPAGHLGPGGGRRPRRRRRLGRPGRSLCSACPTAIRGRATRV